MQGTAGISKYQRPAWSVLVMGARAVLIGLLIYIAVKSLEPSSHFQSVPHMDKVAHALAYGSVMSAAIFALPKQRLPVLIVWVTAYGIAIEIAQGLIGNGRTLSGLDAVANGFGAVIIAGLWIPLCSFMRRLNLIA